MKRTAVRDSFSERFFSSPRFFSTPRMTPIWKVLVMEVRAENFHGQMLRGTSFDWAFKLPLVLPLVGVAYVGRELVRPCESRWFCSFLETSKERASERFRTVVFSPNVPYQFPVPGERTSIGTVGVRTGKHLGGSARSVLGGRRTNI